MNEGKTNPRDKVISEVAKVTVKSKEKPDSEGKKILLPKSIKALVANCQKLLKEKKPILCLLNTDGYVIESISEIVAGSVIYASTVDPAFEPHAPGSKSAGAVVLTQSSAAQVNEAPLTPSTEPKVAATPRKTPTRQPVKLAVTTPKQSEDATAKSPILLRYGKDNSSMRSPSPSVSKGKIDMRKVSRLPSSSDGEEDDPPPDIRSVSTRFTAYMSRAADSSSDDEDPELKQRREERKKKIEMMKSCVLLDDEVNRPFQQLMEELIPPSQAPTTLEQGLACLKQERVKFIQSVSDLEGEQLYNWIQGAADQPFLRRYPQQPYHDPITQIVTEFFRRHRFTSGRNAVFSFRGAVIGPRKSGKSTLLGNAVDQYLLELATTGLWKTTFVFAIDMKLLAPMFHDYVKFYHTLIDHVLDACQKQRPCITPHVKNIRKQLRSATENRPPLAGHHPFPGVDLIAQRINDVWREPTAFEQFLTNVFILPVLLPKALGYKYVSIFCDNFEYSDVQIVPTAPFVDALYTTIWEDMKKKVIAKPVIAFACEHVKFALRQANFIICSETIPQLYNTMNATDGQGIDLMHGLDLITLYEALEDLGSREKYNYVLNVQEEPLPIRITVAMCGGIVAYLSAWDELNHTLFQLERTPQDDDKYDEFYYQAISDAQALVDLLFVCEDANKITVTSVKREKRNENGKTKIVTKKKQ